MELSIIILNYKSSQLIKYQLKKLANYNFNFDTEIIVIDNDSRDDIESIVQEFPNVKFIQSGKNIGFCAANNLAAKSARGKYIMILNPDIRIEQFTIEKLYETLKSNDNIGIIGPRLINADGSTQETSFTFPNIYYPLFRRTFLGKTKIGQKWLYKFLLKDKDRTKNFEVDWLQGACFIIKMHVFNKINGYDEKIFMYLDDMDLCRRVWEAGYSVYYMGEVTAIHLHQKMSANKNIFISIFTNKLSRIHIKSWLHYIKKYSGMDFPKNCPSGKNYSNSQVK
ncbi:MAG TPA: glycosyltransferase family 2 protein [bacterium]|jgi:hypothetical protein|nr:glycosyltransferase family 2 protein [bacterium]HOG37857.1 glycosyltransferase family 2 protein [bacterium]HQI03074.1 glycosyltransferase family 2 protein [bacterium]